MKSILFIDKGNGKREAVPLSNRDSARLSLFRGGDVNNGLDLRVNAAATTAENATGYQILIDTLTYIKQQQATQTYYELGREGKKPSDFVPIAVGEGAWAGNILTRRVYNNSGDFWSGISRQSLGNERKPIADVSMDSVSQQTFIWVEGVQYSLAEIEQALVASNWDVIAAKHASRQKQYQLGIQEAVFLGSPDGALEGLLNTSSVNTNTSFITKYLKSMTAAELQTFVAGAVGTYFSNTNNTVLPNRFVIPMQDYMGLQVLVPGTVGTYPVPLIQYLETAFKGVCGDNFKIEGVAYADAAVNNTRRGINKNIYALYRYDSEALRMDIPVDYTTTQPNTLDNWTFQDVAYSQFTGVGFFKPLETLLFTFAP